ncbi:MAG: hypothetical protein JWN72_2625, partial [Thermoleophilia bacterium]|nr:hypothetical protein [Thermoleophilia bacterium]
PPPPSHVKTLGTTMNHTTLRPLVQLWPDVGRAIADPDRRGARTLTQVSQVIRHELEHVRACLPGIAIGGPLEEGIAETLTRWPGVPRQSRDLLGFPTTGPSTPWAYPRETDAVRRLLRAGGIDTRDASDRQEALEALRGSSPDETPFALARLVAGERHMDDTSTNELAHGISAAFDGRDRPDLAVRRLVDGLPPRSR